MAQKPLMGRVLCGDGLRQLRQIKPQRHRVQIRPQAVEQFQSGPLVGVVPVALFVKRPLGVGQRLGAGGEFAPLAADAPGDDRELAPLRCQEG